MSWLDDVTAMATSLGIPSRILYSVIQVESGFQPTAIGDNGTSFGILQLHVGGQAPNGVPTTALLDPVTNAKYGLPALVKGLQAAGPFNDSLAWWNTFASASGHPGGNLAQSANEAAQLKSAYDANRFNVPGTPLTGQVPSANVDLTSNSSSALDTLPQFMQGVGFEVLLFTIAVTLLIVAFLLVKE
jgi:soluble lytic murein transglycosylase-like protein